MTYWMLDSVSFGLGCYYVVSSIIAGHLIQFVCALVWLWAYPLPLELVSNWIAKLQTKSYDHIGLASRFVYHPDYNISLFGLEQAHPIDSQKYAKVYQQLIKKGHIKRGSQIRPNRASRALLIQKIRKTYLIKLCYGFVISEYLELPYWWIPAWVYRWRILDPMLLATEGSILAAMAALRLGWAVNLSGGYHHASYDRGGGFCIYPDISLIVHYLQTRMRVRRIMIVDLDAHQGNGFQRDLIINEDVYIVDCYHVKLFPQDFESKDAIAKVLQINSTTTNEEYLKMLDSLKQDFDFWHPQLVIYNAGTDVLVEDPLGQLGLSKQTVIKRDEKLVGMCRERRIPVVMLLSGGYQDASVEVIVDSLSNLCSKFA